MRNYIAVFLLFFSAVSVADNTPSPGQEIFVDGAKGYWFYKEPVKPTPDERQEQERQVSRAETKPSESERCGKAATWTLDCGFVNPGMDFAFQEKQRDALMQRMALAPDDAVAVEAFQRYNKWVVGQAVKAAQMWQWNLAQRPDLDPTVQAPISTFGLGLVSEVNRAASKELWKYIADNGGFLVAFTREDCIYCHHMLPTWASVQKTTGIPFYFAPIDGKCLKKVHPDACLPGKTAFDSASVLRVSVVPALFLYVPDQTWIRVATGVASETAITGRITNFFAAYRTGLARGLASDGPTPKVSFDGHDLGLVQGGRGTGVGPATQKEMHELLRGGSYTKK